MKIDRWIVKNNMQLEHFIQFCYGSRWWAANAANVIVLVVIPLRCMIGSLAQNTKANSVRPWRINVSGNLFT